MKFLNIKEKNNYKLSLLKAFTLVELIIVIIILGFLAGIAVQKMGGSTNGAEISKLKSDGKNVINTSNMLVLKNPINYTMLNNSITVLSSGVSYKDDLVGANCGSGTSLDSFSFTLENSVGEVSYDSCVDGVMLYTSK